MIRNEKMRDALKELESTVTATLAHQPEDDEKCSQFLYDALAKVYNIADLACHEARDKCAAPAVNGAKLREAASYLTSIFDCDIQFLERHAKELRDTGAYGGGIIEHILHSITLARAALAEPARNCDVGTAEEQRERFSNFCTNNTDPEDIDGWRCDKRCPLYKDHPNCGWEWLHLPYASEATPCSE